MIRSLSRALDILTIFNKRDSASASEIASELKIPRSSVYRILETLIDKDFIYQHKSDRRFRLSQKIRTLSDGYTEEDHMANISRSFLEGFTKKHNWPATLATLSGLSIVVRENTDLQSPLAVEEFTIGYRMAILDTASGYCILAHMAADRRRILLEMLAKTVPGEMTKASSSSGFKKEMENIRRAGFAVRDRTRRYDDQTAISVPIMISEDDVKGALTVRYSKSAYPLEKAIGMFLPSLRKAAEGIGDRIEKHIKRQKKLWTENIQA